MCNLTYSHRKHWQNNTPYVYSTSCPRIDVERTTSGNKVLKGVGVPQGTQLVPTMHSRGIVFGTLPWIYYEKLEVTACCFTCCFVRFKVYWNYKRDNSHYNSVKSRYNRTRMFITQFYLKSYFRSYIHMMYVRVKTSVQKWHYLSKTISRTCCVCVTKRVKRNLADISFFKLWQGYYY